MSGIDFVGPPMAVSFHRCCFQAHKDTWVALAEKFRASKQERLANTITDGLANQAKRAERNYGYDREWIGLCFRDGSIAVIYAEMQRLYAEWDTGPDATVS